MVSIHKRIMFSVSNSFLGGSRDFNKKYERLSTLYQFLNLFCLTQAEKLLNIDTSNCPMCRKSLRKCEAMLFHYVPGKIISQKPESSKRGGNLGKKLKPAPGFVAVLISFWKSGGFPSHLRLQLPSLALCSRLCSTYALGTHTQPICCIRPVPWHRYNMSMVASS